MQTDQGDQWRHLFISFKTSYVREPMMVLMLSKSFSISGRDCPCMVSTAAIPRSRLIWTFIPSNKCCNTNADESFVASTAVFQDAVVGLPDLHFSKASR